MACEKCGGYYCCKCDLLTVKYKIRIIKLELDSLELQKIKLKEKHAKHDHHQDQKIDEELWEPFNGLKKLR